jgi:hypothetical protein
LPADEWLAACANCQWRWKKSVTASALLTALFAMNDQKISACDEPDDHSRHNDDFQLHVALPRRQVGEK